MKNFLKLFKNHKKDAILAPLLKMLEAILELFVPLIVKDIIDNVIPAKDMKALILHILLMVLFGLVGLIIAIIAQYKSAKVATLIAKDIKFNMMQKLENLSYEDLDEIGNNSLVTKLTNDANQIQSGINMFLRLFLRSPFIVIGAIIMSLVVNLKLGLIFVVVIPTLFAVVIFIILKSIPLFKKLQEKFDKNIKRTKDNITGIRVVRAFNGEDNEINANKKETKDYYEYQNKIALFTQTMSPITYLIINLAIIAIIYFGSEMVQNSSLLKGDVVALYNYMSQVLVEIIKLANLSLLLAKTFACVNRYNEFINIKEKQTYLEESNLKDNETDKIIELKNVNFQYAKNNHLTLKDLNIEIKKGEFVAVVGRTGSGKSTLINLLNRSYDKTTGEILINNNDINNYSKKDIKDYVLVTNNHFFFLNDTISNNITLRQEYDRAQIDEAILLSKSTDIVDKKGGIEGLISEGGKNLSGGEKERIQVARAILKKAPIMIFDASLEALDSKTFNEVITNLRNLNSTLIIATERVSNIKMADKIIVLENGVITGFSSHDELLKTNLEYQNIYKLNTKDGDLQ